MKPELDLPACQKTPVQPWAWNRKHRILSSQGFVVLIVMEAPLTGDATPCLSGRPCCITLTIVRIGYITLCSAE